MTCRSQAKRRADPRASGSCRRWALGCSPSEAQGFKTDFVMKGDFMMKKYLFSLIAGVGVVATSWFVLTRPIAAQTQQSAAVFNPDGTMQLPTGFRKWVFVGAPLTPNALNNGRANFPEYHHVYIEQKNVDVYLQTGEFPEGTVIVKELTRVLDPAFPDGSRKEP